MSSCFVFFYNSTGIRLFLSLWKIVMQHTLTTGNQIMCWKCTVTNGTRRGDALEFVYIMCLLRGWFIGGDWNEPASPDTLHYTEPNFAPEVRKSQLFKHKPHPVLYCCGTAASLASYENKRLKETWSITTNNCLYICCVDNEDPDNSSCLVQCDAWGDIQVGALSFLTSAFID